MYLSKIELSGFKSFAQRTVLQFDPGVTAIVGPNGCGKSNIVDAVRWVIGEQRARILRSEKMENVIFNGTSRRKPLGMAEVLLTIENNRGVLPTEYSEVTLGRRLFRSGDSEYLLNDTRCRLQDITDLFMDTGMGAGAYSVIELKMVDEILSENAHDRRRLFEEAAGITRYKLRRRQALTKLEGTQADLIRLRDLTDEIDKQVRSLKRQADKAARYREYEERLRRLELTLAQLEYERLSGQIEGLESEVRLLQGQIETYTAQQDAEEDRLDGLRETLTSREQELTQRQYELNQHLDRVRRIESDLRLSQERLESARRDRIRIEQERQEAARQRESLVQSTGRLQQEIREARPVLEEAERVQNAARTHRDALQRRSDEHRSRVEAARQAVQRAEDRRGDVQRKLDRLQSRLELLEADRARVEVQLRESEPIQTDLFAQTENASVDVERAAARLATDRAVLTDLRAQEASLNDRLDAARDALRKAERARDAAAAEVALLESIVSSYQDLSGSIQYLASAPDWSADGLVTVSDLIGCAEEDRAAVDAALGAFGSCIVVQTELEADRALSLLRHEAKGRATFIVLDRLPDAPERPSPHTGHPHESTCPLRQRVRLADEKYRRLADLLFGDCFLVDSLEGARAVVEAEPSARYFAASGEWLDARGILHGGSPEAGVSASGNRLGRRDQLDSARSALSELELELERRTLDLNELQQAMEALPLQETIARVAASEAGVADAEKIATRTSLESESFARRRDELEERHARIVNETATDRQEVEALEAELLEASEGLDRLRAERASSEEAFAETEARAREAIQQFSDANVSAVQARNYFDNLERDLGRAQRELQQLEEKSRQHAEALDTLAEAIDDVEARRSTLAASFDSTLDERGALEASTKEAEDQVASAKAAITDVESRLRVIRQQREQVVRDENQRAVRLAEATTRRDDLLANVLEDFGVSLPNQPVAIEDDFDVAPARQEVQELRLRIRNLGAVNALALESYEEESQRLAFLVTQRDDLERAEKTLLETISEINTTASERFRETFAAIDSYFSDIFADLFVDDAAAHLQLVDENDPLESPIEIIAKPRGKRPTGIAQLSGGEKTLTAIALLFAIYLVKPSPFCILDEVDAPLDDANVDRFMSLIRRFSTSTQFILVTHNKRTMELADRMYGVTMQEQGVSKLVGVRFDEAVEMVG